MGVRTLCRKLHLRGSGVRSGEQQVFTDGRMKQDGFLRHVADLPSPSVKGRARQIMRAKRDRPGQRRYESQQDVHERRLSSARAADNTDHAGYWHGQIDVLEHTAFVELHRHIAQYQLRRQWNRKPFGGAVPSFGMSLDSALQFVDLDDRMQKAVEEMQVALNRRDARK